MARAETTTFSVSQDTCLWELDGEYNLGTQRDLPAGALGAMGDGKRARILFQVELNLPASSVIASARYRVPVVTAPPGRADSTFALHRVLVPWREGDKRGDNPGGQPATDGEPSWEAREHPAISWSVPGGEIGVDYALAPSAIAAVRGEGEVVFEFNAQGVSDLQMMLEQPEENYGWVMLKQQEGTLKTARRFAAREHRTTPPRLEIGYETNEASLRLVPAISLGAAQGVVEISAPVIPGKSYVLQCSRGLAPDDWKNQGNEAEIVQGKVRFRKLMNESSQFLRIIEE